MREIERGAYVRAFVAISKHYLDFPVCMAYIHGIALVFGLQALELFSCALSRFRLFPVHRYQCKSLKVPFVMYFLKRLFILQFFLLICI